MTNDECVELAIRITQRAQDGVVSFRLLTAAEELPMVRAFDDVLGRLIATIAHAEVIAADNAALRAEVEDCRRRARDGINID
jgi:hypothetical protein